MTMRSNELSVFCFDQIIMIPKDILIRIIIRWEKRWGVGCNLQKNTHPIKKEREEYGFGTNHGKIKILQLHMQESLLAFLCINLYKNRHKYMRKKTTFSRRSSSTKASGSNASERGRSPCSYFFFNYTMK